MRKNFIIGLGVVAALGLSACSEQSQDKVEQAGSAIGNDLESGINNADDKAVAGADKVGGMLDNAGDEIGAAASNVGADLEGEAKDAKKDAGSTLEKAGNDLKN